MIRAVTITAGGQPLMLLGLSGENVARLAAGEPIVFDGAPLGYQGRICIMYGRTEEAILAELKRNGVKLIEMRDPGE